MDEQAPAAAAETGGSSAQPGYGVGPWPGGESEWPEGGSVDEVVDALTGVGTPLPLSSGHAFGDGQVLAFLDFWKHMRDWSGRPNDWLVPLLHHLFGERDAERLLDEGGWWT